MAFVSLWKEVHKHAPPHIEVLMVGNKEDLKDQRQVSEAEMEVNRSCLAPSVHTELSFPMQAAADEFGLQMLTCSACDQAKVFKCLSTLTSRILERRKAKK